MVNNINDNWNKQPVYVPNDVSYDRMLKKLEAGERFVKSYRNICPHRNTDAKCECVFHLNFLKDGSLCGWCN